MNRRNLISIDNDPIPHIWGARDGITSVLGRAPISVSPEAELWLGAHPRSPSRIIELSPWADLYEWERETGSQLQYLLKLLHAAQPLSLQVHPTSAQAARGFRAEEAANLPLDAASRNYSDMRSKPEMIVALRDGFEALCGFRVSSEVERLIDRLLGTHGPHVSIERWLHLLRKEGTGGAVRWLLSGDLLVVQLVEILQEATHDGSGLSLFERDLVSRLSTAHPGDGGIAVALMLNHVELAKGQAMWVSPGTIHAYLQGLGLELMGPSDNVLRGGLTSKHLDVDELLAIIDSTSGPPQFITPVAIGSGAHSYSFPDSNPPSATLFAVTHDTDFDIPGPAVLLGLDGSFTVSSLTGESMGESRVLSQGDMIFHRLAGTLEVRGAGELYIATGALRSRAA